ncbi:MAG: hypothetical protein A2934_02075 [Candidatus Sungbacteria bacterium RIFCSPLOWO2_01_FULL_47_10]|uniref:Uncharacterized protein n=1 Tax=Candidatus Sungbacteria bacterium RIFCSPLOWO2_01_FULL_47_10 TaxID=1802276 RepID=A0A1G2KXV6_9BACT|nr:MAG: hypothetical protein A2934_02075 [Candidatus Sungbacteria bacterium RIFCSPLOWO2_01_FULL_47_10]
MKESSDILESLRVDQEKLKKELAELRAFHQDAWNKYGSELCAGEMREKEKELERRILLLVQMAHWVEGSRVDETLLCVVLSKIKRVIDDKESLLVYIRESLEADKTRKVMYEEIASLAGIEVNSKDEHASPVNNG